MDELLKSINQARKEWLLHTTNERQQRFDDAVIKALRRYRKRNWWRLFAL